VPELEIRAATGALPDPLLRDYLAGAPALAPFYAGHPGDAAAYQRKAAEVAARLDGTAPLASGPAIEALGDAAPRLQRILAGDGFFVTTGQQPALFGGPMYTLYKALAAINLAARLEDQLGRPVLAMFWIGADDHDWDEANHASLLDGNGDVRTITVHAAASAPPVPLSERRWGPGIHSAVAEFLALLPDTVHADAVREHVRSAYTADATVAESFTATLRLLLAGQRIALISSAAPALRQAAVPVLLREAERTGEHGAAVARQTERLEAAGYPAQVAVAADASNLMLLAEGGRDRLVRGRRGWQARRSGTFLPHDELLRRVAAEPLRFSPNVLLRPVVESAVLPTLAYVAGPAEVRYFAQIGCLFRAHGILPPVVVPRPGATLVPRRVRRALGRLGLEADALARPYDELVREQARPPCRPPWRRRSAGCAMTSLPAMPSWATRPRTWTPRWRGRCARRINESLRRADAAERRILASLSRRETGRLDDLRRAVAALRPGGAPQERVHGPLPFLAEHGPDLVPALASALQPVSGRVADWRGTGCEE
jgi:bacillithiol synthase